MILVCIYKANQIVTATNIVKQSSTIICCSHTTTTPSPSISSTTYLSPSSTIDTTEESASSIIPLVGLSLGISATILLLALVVIITIASLWINIRRKAAKQDHPHSTDQEENTQSQSQANANVYEQFHLSPSTEFISPTGNEPISNIPWQSQADLHSSIDAGQPKPISQEMEEDPMYAAIEKGNNKEQHKDSHDGSPLHSNNQNVAATYDKASATDDSEQKLGEDALKEMYTVVSKNLRIDKEESAPPIPPQVVDKLCIPADQKNPNSTTVTIHNEEALSMPPLSAEELYTAIKKRPKEDENEEIAPPIPPHTVEELYTAIMKKPKGNAETEEQTPPILPYTVEELYTAVQKKPKDADTVDNEEEAPPIPPYTVD